MNLPLHAPPVERNEWQVIFREWLEQQRQRKMTPTEAFDIAFAIAQRVPLVWADHERAAEAMQVLHALVQPPPPLPPAEPAADVTEES